MQDMQVGQQSYERMTSENTIRRKISSRTRVEESAHTTTTATIMSLLQEVENNIGTNDIILRDLPNISNMYSHHNHVYHQYMKSQQIELSDAESMVIKLWTSSEQFTKLYHIACSNGNEDKWKLFIQSMTSAVLKIYIAMILDNASNKGENRVFPSIPNQLYRGTKMFDTTSKIWKANSILSFTKSFTIAESFAALSQSEKQKKHKTQNCILKINNVQKCLKEQKLFSAPIDWLSDYEYEQEWIVLPNPNVTFNVKKSSEKVIGGNLFNLIC